MDDVYNSNREQRLKRFFHSIFGQQTDGSIEALLQCVSWKNVESGTILFKQDSLGNEMYFIVTGRFRSSIKNLASEEKNFGELTSGNIMGELAILSDSPRHMTVSCIRDSVVAVLTKKAFSQLSDQYPHLLKTISKITIDHLTAYIKSGDNKIDTVTNLFIYPISKNLDIEFFENNLITALEVYGPVFRLCSKTIVEKFGTDYATNPKKQTLLFQWFEKIEAEHRYVLYVASCVDLDWHKHALRQADRVILVADHREAPTPTAQEVALFQDNKTKTILTLLHKNRQEIGHATQDFLHHRKIFQHIHMLECNPKDIQKLARFINGTANGLVFAGGGAQGFVHLGVIKAFVENDIPIDMVGGTSMGAIMAGAYALRMDIDTLIDEVRDIFVNRKPLTDYTFPFISIFSGRKLDRLLYEFYGEASIEDCWTNFFCIAANLSQVEQTVHTSGSLWKAIRSSLSLPGIIPPVSINGDYHIDGGLVNNYPVDVMRQQGAGIVIGVNLASTPPQTEKEKKQITTKPSLLNLVIKKLCRSTHNNELLTLGIGQIILRSALLSSDKISKQNAALADIHWELNASTYGLLKFSKFDNIMDIGYQHATKAIADMSEEELHKLRY